MPIGPKLWFICLALYLSFFSKSALADRNIQLDAVLGNAIPSNSAFKGSVIQSFAFTYASTALNYRIGIIDFGHFDLKESNNKSRLNIKGAYLELIKVVEVDIAKLEMGVGIMASETDMIFIGEKFREESDTSPFVEVSVSKDLGQLITINAGIYWISDLSGSDITIPKVAMRFSF